MSDIENCCSRNVERMFDYLVEFCRITDTFKFKLFIELEMMGCHALFQKSVDREDKITKILCRVLCPGTAVIIPSQLPFPRFPSRGLVGLELEV